MIDLKSAKAYQKRKQRFTERNRIAAMDWPAIRASLLPAVACHQDPDRACYVWASFAYTYLKGQGINPTLWRGVARSCRRSPYRFSQHYLRSHPAFLAAMASPVPGAVIREGCADYHCWVETKDCIVDLGNPYEVWLTRLDEPINYFYIPQTRTKPVAMGRGFFNFDWEEMTKGHKLVNQTLN